MAMLLLVFSAPILFSVVRKARKNYVKETGVAQAQESMGVNSISSLGLESLDMGGIG